MVAVVAVAVGSTVLATVCGLLPERVDLMFVFAAYGAGSVIGTVIAVRGRQDPVVLGIRGVCSSRRAPRSSSSWG